VFIGSGIQNVNGDADFAFDVEPPRRVLARVDVSYSKSIIEAWWRSLRHLWLYINRLDKIVTLRKLAHWITPPRWPNS